MGSLAERVRTAATLDELRVPPPVPWVGLDLAVVGEVLFVALGNALLEQSLHRRGLTTLRVATIAEARWRMRERVFAVVVIEPDVGGDDGVSFAVGVKQGAEATLPPLWRDVPFVVLPEAGDNQAVVVTGASAATAIEGNREELVSAIVRLVTPH
ncbi:MAG: hypothetical protein H6738_24270 [Alphaproteobacteria bacterium]|nr:hypothetical protein [Alphaproteobacteria bacterium]